MVQVEPEHLCIQRDNRITALCQGPKNDSNQDLINKAVMNVPNGLHLSVLLCDFDNNQL